MKRIIPILLLLPLLSVSCKNKGGEMKYKARFQATSTNPIKRSGVDSLHTGFGNYITSITPTRLTGLVDMFVFQDYYSDQDPRCHMISFLEGQRTELDFTGNVELEFKPTLHSTDIRDGLFQQKETDFRFISFVPELWKHEFEIPLQYLPAVKSNSMQFLGGLAIYDSVANTITVNSTRHFSYDALHGNTGGKPSGFMVIFGETDSSSVYLYNGVNLPEEQRFPFWDAANRVIIRSSRFNRQKITMPDKGETFTMYATLSYNTRGLIQVYSGSDKIPYTGDDVFVYAPKFWERIFIELESRKN